ncbi:MAG: hypothetical protein R3E95_05505 [Thiolinea sp.]
MSKRLSTVLAAPNLTLSAKVEYISTADGGSVLLWGYADEDNKADLAQEHNTRTYPDRESGDTVTVNLKNELSVAAGTIPNVSLMFPGQQVAASCNTRDP